MDGESDGDGGGEAKATSVAAAAAAVITPPLRGGEERRAEGQRVEHSLHMHGGGRVAEVRQEQRGNEVGAGRLGHTHRPPTCTKKGPVLVTLMNAKSVPALAGSNKRTPGRVSPPVSTMSCSVMLLTDTRGCVGHVGTTAHPKQGPTTTSNPTTCLPTAMSLLHTAILPHAGREHGREAGMKKQRGQTRGQGLTRVEEGASCARRPRLLLLLGAQPQGVPQGVRSHHVPAPRRNCKVCVRQRKRECVCDGERERVRVRVRVRVKEKARVKVCERESRREREREGEREGERERGGG